MTTPPPGSGRALSFGTDAASYDRHRPGYPQQVLTRILEYAALPIRTALEIGAGTGKATRLIAGHGIEVLATEPDPRMLAVLRERTAGLPVTPVLGSFEELPVPDLAGRVELLYAAAAFHWTDPTTRWDRVAEILPTGGTAAFFGGELELADPDLRATFARVIGDEVAPQAGVPMPGDEQGRPWPASELVADPRFGDVTQHAIPRRQRLTREDFLGHLGTQSRFLTLEPAERAVIFDRVRAVLPDLIDFRADLTLHLARRVTSA
ncbi:MAG TPA: class I SAM-dependent methyltransferase [Microlunatus sp.]|nr:class I SAM-dependent methyltransferase [Microlunatus sp.]